MSTQLTASLPFTGRAFGVLAITAGLETHINKGKQ
jgi:hypothetical protein